MTNVAINAVQTRSAVPPVFAPKPYEMDALHLFINRYAAHVGYHDYEIVEVVAEVPDERLHQE